MVKSKVTGEWIVHQPWGRTPRWEAAFLTSSHPHMMVLVRCIFERAPCSLGSCQPLWAQPPSLPQMPPPLPDPAVESPLSPWRCRANHNILLLPNPILHLRLPAKSPTPSSPGTSHWSWLKRDVTTITSTNNACTAKRNFCPPGSPPRLPSSVIAAPLVPPQAGQDGISGLCNWRQKARRTYLKK